ncbi:HAMP domain-containing sensor histidine kinase [Lutimonas halocynthiae]|uniref:sensor histidine kinase n=1 Tax=Lutimonas halocynthiae TaxID=1446477 RepID=UPI0025B3B3C8|nr:HAMP domain-containing sensor histidine kinase [Lutimonas halocynthiae]MDN3643545.1 HAMP domain-containing sensor histidine kinase [Lutimonas halocynthiae]
MGKRHLYIVLFIIAILGLSFIQYQYFRIGLNLAGVQFNQKMGEAVKEIKQGLYQRNDLTYLVGTVMAENEANFLLSMDSVQDATNYFMDEFLKQKLLQNGVKAEYSYSLYDQDSTHFLTSEESFSKKDKILSYPVALDGYLPGLINKRVTLELQFKNVNRYFLSQLNGLTIPSIIFLIVIIVVILWVYRAFYLQNNLIVTTNEFINNLTHELKTPVFSIGVASKILEEKGHKDTKELVGIIRAQVEKLKTQIEKVLELGNIEERKGFVKHIELDVKPILDHVVQSFEQQARLNEFSFESDIQGDSFLILGDAYHLENAISSLIENAIKYSGDQTDIVFSAFKKGDKLLISVVDKGIGINQEDIKKIFEKYYRVVDGDLHNVKGHGLGLHYVKRIVHLHKGKIKVESKIGLGSTFTVILPLK